MFFSKFSLCLLLSREISPKHLPPDLVSNFERRIPSCPVTPVIILIDTFKHYITREAIAFSILFVVTTILLRPALFRLGAEELDGLFLERNLSTISQDFIVFQLSQDLSFLEVRHVRDGGLIKEELFPLMRKLSLKDRVVRAIIGDPAGRSYLKIGFSASVRYYLKNNQITVSNLICSNSSLMSVCLSIKAQNRISRSVNFEPLHYLYENNFSLKSPFVFFLKVWATQIERLFFHVHCISPNDLRNYRRFPSARRLNLLPLQQLQNFTPQNFPSVQTSLQVGYLGSTYNVRHNRRGFDFVVNGVAKRLIDSNVHFNIYGVKPPLGDYPQNVTIHGWVEPISSIYELNQVFLVPYLGGTGQQSKFFEPLCKGKLIIASPKATGGYPIEPNSHYLAASTVLEFSKVISSILDGTRKIDFILSKLANDSFSQFSKESNFKALRDFLN